MRVELTLHLVQVGLDEDVAQLVIGGEQALLQLSLQAALHVQVVDGAQHQDGNEEQKQAQAHPGTRDQVFWRLLAYPTLTPCYP